MSDTVAGYLVTTALTAVDLQASPPAPQRVNSTITLTATPTGGANVEYWFEVSYVDATGVRQHVTLRPYGPSRTCLWMPTEARSYTVTVYAREVGSTGRYSVMKSIGYSISR